MSWRAELKVAHHGGEYSSRILNMSVKELLDLLKERRPDLYEAVESELDSVDIEDYDRMYDMAEEGLRGIEAKTPPGREKQVLELKKKFPKEVAYAIAWDSYNKSKKKKKKK